LQYYPQHYYGFVVDNDVARRLELAEAYDVYEMSYDEEHFFEGFQEKYGVEPYKFADTTYERGGYVQGLNGFEWDKTYICFAPSQAGDDRWNKMLFALEEAGILMQEGKWSELG